MVGTFGLFPLHSKSVALAQLLRNEVLLNRNALLKEQYDMVIQEYLDLRHMKPAISELRKELESAGFL